jgi:hypothetical protein
MHYSWPSLRHRPELACSSKKNRNIALRNIGFSQRWGTADFFGFQGSMGDVGSKSLRNVSTVVSDSIPEGNNDQNNIFLSEERYA